jgi:hypothetical protein
MFLTSTTDAYNTHSIPDKPITLQTVRPYHAPTPRAKHGMGQGGGRDSYRDQLSVSEPVSHFYAFFMQHKKNALRGGHDYPVCDLASAPVLKILYKTFTKSCHTIPILGYTDLYNMARFACHKLAFICTHPVTRSTHFLLILEPSNKSCREIRTFRHDSMEAGFTYGHE